MTTKACPKCDRTSLQYQENYGYWECLDCGHMWALDADDPDYDDAGEDSVSCWDCWGTGRVYVLDSPMKCKGTGYI